MRSKRTASVPPSPRLGVLINRVRQREGIDLRTLARRIKYSASVLERLECGSYAPGKMLLERLETALKFRRTERVELQSFIAGAGLRRTPPIKVPLPESVLYRLSEARHHLRCNEQKFRELLEDGEFELIDIRSKGASKPTWRVRRRSLEAFLERRMAKL